MQIKLAKLKKRNQEGEGELLRRLIQLMNKVDHKVQIQELKVEEKHGRQSHSLTKNR